MDIARRQNFLEDREDFLAVLVARQALEIFDRIAVDADHRKLRHVVARPEQRPQLLDLAAPGGFKQTRRAALHFRRQLAEAS